MDQDNVSIDARQLLADFINGLSDEQKIALSDYLQHKFGDVKGILLPGQTRSFDDVNDEMMRVASLKVRQAGEPLNKNYPKPW